MVTRSEPIRVLLFAFFFPPEMVTGALRPYRFYKYLPEFGVEPWVITGSEQNGAVERVIQAPAPTRRPNKKILLGATEKAMRLCVFPADDAVMWSLSAVGTAKELLKSVRVNAHMAAARLHRQFKLPWVADFRDPLAGRPPATGLPNRVNWYLERQYVKEAAAVIAVSDVVRDEWEGAIPELQRQISRTMERIRSRRRYLCPTHSAPKTACDRACRKHVLEFAENFDGRRQAATLANLLAAVIEKPR